MFWETSTYRDLVNKWRSPTIFDLLGVAHDEKVFTRMLDISLDDTIVGADFAKNVFVGMLNRVVEKGSISEGSVLAELNARVGTPGALIGIQPEMEIPIDIEQDGVRFLGFIDLMIDATIMLEGEERQYRVILENKIRSQEHRLGQHEDGPWQTEGYKIWGDREGVASCYVFLAPDDGVQCHCQDYFRLNYQDVIDILSRNINRLQDQNLRMLFVNFINTMGPSLLTNERYIMAITSEERDMLTTFWNNEQNREQVMFLIDTLLQQGIESVSEADRRRMQSVLERSRTSIIFRVGGDDVDVERFRREFLRVGRAERILCFSDGHEESKPWILQRLGENANIRGNIQSQNWWRDRQGTGLVSVVCQVG